MGRGRTRTLLKLRKEEEGGGEEVEEEGETEGGEEEEREEEVEGEADAWRDESVPMAPAVGGDDAAATAAAAAAEGGLKRRLEGGRVGKGINPPLTVLRRVEEDGGRVGLVLVLGMESLSGRASKEEEESEGVRAGWAWCWGLLPPALACWAGATAALVVLSKRARRRLGRETVANALLGRVVEDVRIVLLVCVCGCLVGRVGVRTW